MVYQNFIPEVTHPFGQSVTCPDLYYPKPDLEAARRLIEDYGLPVEVECLHSDTLRGRNTGELLQQLFNRIGVRLNLVGVSPAGSIMKIFDGDYQLATWRILSSRDYGPYLYRSYHSQSPANLLLCARPLQVFQIKEY